MDKNISPYLAEQIWNQLFAIYSRMNDAIKNDIDFNRKSKEKFCKYFVNIYRDVEQKTEHEKDVLGRHTVSAIIAATIIKIKPLSDKNGRTNENICFIANEVVALVFALEYLKSQINELLEESDCYEKITNFIVTTPINKNTREFDDLVRNLYLEAQRNRNSISVETWTTMFSLIEQTTLAKYGINLPKKDNQNIVVSPSENSTTAP